MTAMTDRRRALARAAWRTLTSREAYANPWIRVREDVAEIQSHGTPAAVRGILKLVIQNGAAPASSRPTTRPWST